MRAAWSMSGAARRTTIDDAARRALSGCWASCWRPGRWRSRPGPRAGCPARRRPSGKRRATRSRRRAVMRQRRPPRRRASAVPSSTPSPKAAAMPTAARQPAAARPTAPEGPSYTLGLFVALACAAALGWLTWKSSGLSWSGRPPPRSCVIRGKCSQHPPALHRLPLFVSLSFTATATLSWSYRASGSLQSSARLLQTPLAPLPGFLLTH